MLRNAGTKGSPTFPQMTTLVEALPGASGSKQIKRVPALDGSPVAPGSSFHVELIDYDHDGDLDLLVGGRSKWLTGPEKEPTEEDLELASKLKKDSEAAWAKFRAYKDSAADEAELEKLEASEKYRTLLADYHSLRRQAFAVTADPEESGDFIWLFRRK